MTTPFVPAGSELTALRDHAREGASRAYVPYSTFPVGAALHFRDGDVVIGCNVENASFGLTVCAERTAIVRAIAEGRNLAEVDQVAVHVDGPEGQPCGMCRQVLSEFVPHARIAFVANGEYVEGSVMDLLPAAFEAGALVE